MFPSTRFRTGALAVLILALGACLGSSTPIGTTPDDGPEGETEIELADLMGALAHHGAKLGYAIQGENRPLAVFYLEEVHEVLEELEAVESYEGLPIAHPAGVILAPALRELETALTGDTPWTVVGTSYEATIDACNRCHQATEHGFIEILPATGEPPYLQRFEVSEAR